jgi:hypothetical protein
MLKYAFNVMAVTLNRLVCIWDYFILGHIVCHILEQLLSIFCILCTNIHFVKISHTTVKTIKTKLISNLHFSIVRMKLQFHWICRLWTSKVLKRQFDTMSIILIYWRYHFWQRSTLRYQVTTLQLTAAIFWFYSWLTEISFHSVCTKMINNDLLRLITHRQ